MYVCASMSMCACMHTFKSAHKCAYMYMHMIYIPHQTTVFHQFLHPSLILLVPLGDTQDMEICCKFFLSNRVAEISTNKKIETTLFM